MEKGKRILLTLLFVILAAMGIMAGTFLAGGGLKPRPGVDRGERETAQAYPEPSEGQTAGAEAGQEIKDSQEMKNGQETKTSIRLETAAEETEMETDADVPEGRAGSRVLFYLPGTFICRSMCWARTAVPEISPESWTRGSLRRLWERIFLW